MEEDEVVAAAQAGIADIEAGRFTTVATAEDEQRLHEGIMAQLRARLTAEE